MPSRWVFWPSLSIGFALLDFDAAFAAFHAIFFESGTWTFAADSLIIQLFPVRFWAARGLRWRSGTPRRGPDALGFGGRDAIFGPQEHDKTLKKCKTFHGRISRPRGTTVGSAPEAGAQAANAKEVTGTWQLKKDTV